MVRLYTCLVLLLNGHMIYFASFSSYSILLW